MGTVPFAIVGARPEDVLAALGAAGEQGYLVYVGTEPGLPPGVEVGLVLLGLEHGVQASLAAVRDLGEHAPVVLLQGELDAGVESAARDAGCVGCWWTGADEHELQALLGDAALPRTFHVDHQLDSLVAAESSERFVAFS